MMIYVTPLMCVMTGTGEARGFAVGAGGCSGVQGQSAWLGVAP